MVPSLWRIGSVINPSHFAEPFPVMRRLLSFFFYAYKQRLIIGACGSNMKRERKHSILTVASQPSIPRAASVRREVFYN